MYVTSFAVEQPDSMADWLAILGLSYYEASFLANGYDDIAFIVRIDNEMIIVHVNNETNSVCIQYLSSEHRQMKCYFIQS